MLVVLDGSPAGEKENLRKELNLMKSFKTHPNVVELLGSFEDKGMGVWY